MLKYDETDYITINPKLKRRFTLNPAAHLSEVDCEQYHDGKLIRSSFADRLIDAYLYFSGCFYRDVDKDEIVGGKAGILDFLIPHYFVALAWDWWTKDIVRVFAGFLITIPLGILCYALFAIKHILSFALTIVSVPFIGIAHRIYLAEYLGMKRSINKLIIAKEDPAYINEPQQVGSVENSSESTAETVAESEPNKIVKKLLKPISFKDGFAHTATYPTSKKYPHLIEHVPSFRTFFSNMNSKIQLVEDKKNNLYIEVSKPPESRSSKESENKNKTFFIKVDPKNSKPLQQALHLNIFGMTSYIENKKNEEGQSYLDRVHEASVSEPNINR